MCRGVGRLTTEIDRKIAQELGVRERQVEAAVDAARRRRHRAVHRPLPQGGDRRARRRAAAHAARSGCATCASWRSGAPRSSTRSASRASSTPRSRRAILAADTKARLEDIYLPYKPKRRTKAQIAREAGLEPLADLLLARPGARTRRRRPPRSSTPTRSVADAAAALDGARAILVERFAEDADLIGALRERMWTQRPAGLARCARARRRPAPSSPTTSTSPSRSPSCRRTGSWRCSAARRRRSSTSTIEPEKARRDAAGRRQPLRAAHHAPLRHRRPRPAGRQLARRDGALGVATQILVHLGIDLRLRLWQAAEEEAVRVFAANLRDLLLAAPAGARADDGPRPRLSHRRQGRGRRRHRQGGGDRRRSTRTSRSGAGTRRSAIARRSWRARTSVELIAIGNGTASRETDKLAAELVKLHAGAEARQGRGVGGRRVGLLRLRLRLAGAARPRRVAARRGLDRAAAAGPAGRAGQDRPEVDRRRPVPARPRPRSSCRARSTRWSRTASTRSASTSTPPRRRCWRASRASARAWRRTSSCTATPTARSDPQGAEGGAAARARRRSSSAPASCASAAATTRSTPPACTRRPIRWCGGSSQATKSDIKALIGNAAVLRALAAEGRSSTRPSACRPSPTSCASWRSRAATRVRPSRRPPSRRASRSSATSSRGMILEGVVTNVAAFGAFVDIGVHQDGLVHVSAMSKTFVKDPRDVVKPGDIVRVKVLDVDMPRKRISLTLRLDDDTAVAKERGQKSGAGGTRTAARRQGEQARPRPGAGLRRRRPRRRPAPRRPRRRPEAAVGRDSVARIERQRNPGPALPLDPAFRCAQCGL